MIDGVSLIQAMDAMGRNAFTDKIPYDLVDATILQNYPSFLCCCRFNYSICPAVNFTSILNFLFTDRFTLTI